jgi:hypothetical protein
VNGGRALSLALAFSRFEGTAQRRFAFPTFFVRAAAIEAMQRARRAWVCNVELLALVRLLPRRFTFVLGHSVTRCRFRTRWAVRTLASTYANGLHAHRPSTH